MDTERENTCTTVTRPRLVPLPSITVTAADQPLRHDHCCDPPRRVFLGPFPERAGVGTGSTVGTGGVEREERDAGSSAAGDESEQGLGRQRSALRGFFRRKSRDGNGAEQQESGGDDGKGDGWEERGGNSRRSWKKSRRRDEDRRKWRSLGDLRKSPESSSEVGKRGPMKSASMPLPAAAVVLPPSASASTSTAPPPPRPVTAAHANSIKSGSESASSGSKLGSSQRAVDESVEVSSSTSLLRHSSKGLIRSGDGNEPVICDEPESDGDDDGDGGSRVDRKGKGKMVRYVTANEELDISLPLPENITKGSQDISGSMSVTSDGVIMRDRMLVRVCFTLQSVGTRFDEEVHRTTQSPEIAHWAEYLVVWRRNRLELYDDPACLLLFTFNSSFPRADFTLCRAFHNVNGSLNENISLSLSH